MRASCTRGDWGSNQLRNVAPRRARSHRLIIPAGARRPPPAEVRTMPKHSAARNAIGALCLLLLGFEPTLAQQSGVTRYVRYQAEGRVSYGILGQNSIQELSGDLFGSPRPTGRTIPLAQAKLLAPVVPKNVIAIGLNYKSH